MAVASMSMVFFPAICIAIYLRTAGDSAIAADAAANASQWTQLWQWGAGRQLCAQCFQTP